MIRAVSTHNLAHRCIALARVSSTGIAKCVARGAIALMVAAVLTACTSQGSLRVEVRDHVTHQPVAGATVRAEALSFFVPFWPHWRLSPGRSQVGTTDPQGMAHFESVSFPAAIYIVNDQHLPLRLELRDPPDGELLSAEWMTGPNARELDAAGDPLEARVGQ